MRKDIIGSMMIFMALLCTGISFDARAAEPLVYTEGSQSLSMPDGASAMTGGQLGCMGSPQVFENDYTDFAISIPAGFTAELFNDVFYDVDGSLSLYGYVPDLLLSSYLTTAEAPDPEMPEDNTMVLMSFFIGKNRSDGQPRDLNAYMVSVIGNIIRNDKLLPYISISDASLGRNGYLAYKLDYTEALQTYYHTIFAGRAEHPAFDERFPFRAELYARDLGDKYYLILYVKSGEKFESSTDLTSYIF